MEAPGLFKGWQFLLGVFLFMIKTCFFAFLKKPMPSNLLGRKQDNKKDINLKSEAALKPHTLCRERELYEQRKFKKINKFEMMHVKC